MSINKVILLGRLTKNPNIKFTESSEPLCVANFTLAIDRKFKSNEEADFINCIAFKKVAENIEKYVEKGNRLEIIGRLQTSVYEKSDGNKVYNTTVVCEDVIFIDYKHTEDAKKLENNKYIEIPDEDMPF